MNLKFWKKNTGVEITTPEQLQASLMTELMSQSGQRVTRDTAMRLATVFACVRILSESVGTLPCKLYEKRGDQRQVVSDHWAHRLLAVAPNKFMTPQEFWELVMVCLGHGGNFYAYKTKVAGQVRELLPFNPGSVTAKLENWEPVYDVIMEDGKMETFSQTEILHVRIFSKNGLNGLSPIGYARESIGLALAAQAQGNQWFINGVAPSGYLSTDSVLRDDSYNRLKKEFKEKNAGTSNIANPLILEAGLKWVSTTMNAQDLQFLETRKFQRDDICAVYRVPPHMVANLERATFSNIEHQALSFVTNSLVPYLTRIEQRVRVGLLPEKDQVNYYARFNVAGLLRGDLKARYEAYGKGITSGILSPNECRENEDLNPREGGDIYLTPVNMTTNPDSPPSDQQSPEDQNAA